MDLATVIGFTTAVGLNVFCMYSGANGDMTTFWSANAFVLTLFGCAACTMMSLPFSVAMNSWRVALKTVFNKEEKLEQVIQTMVDFATTARQEGLLALENEVADVKDPFLAGALRLVIDGQTKDEVEANLRLQMLSMATRHKKGKKIFEVAGVYAPAYGLLTTIIGQAVMFKNMGSDMGAIGAGMAVALLGTLYGSLLSNLVCLPMADKLGALSQGEMLVKELYLQGVMAICEEQSPTIMKQKMVAFLDYKTAARAEAGA